MFEMFPHIIWRNIVIFMWAGSEFLTNFFQMQNRGSAYLAPPIVGFCNQGHSCCVIRSFCSFYPAVELLYFPDDSGNCQNFWSFFEIVWSNSNFLDVFLRFIMFLCFYTVTLQLQIYLKPFPNPTQNPQFLANHNQTAILENSMHNLFLFLGAVHSNQNSPKFFFWAGKWEIHWKDLITISFYVQVRHTFLLTRLETKKHRWKKKSSKDYRTSYSLLGIAMTCKSAY